MNREKLSLALNELDDRHIRDTANFSPEAAQRSPERTVHMKKKRIITLALAAALILALGVGAYAIGLNWSRSLNNAFSSTSEEDKQRAEDSGLVTSGILASDTNNGVTVSAVDMSADPGRAMVCIRVEGISYPGDMHTDGVNGDDVPRGIRPEAEFYFEYLRDNEVYNTEPSGGIAAYFNETQSYVAPDGSLEFPLDLRHYNGGEIHLRIDRIQYMDLRLDTETYNDMVGDPPTMAEGPWELRWTPNTNEENRVVTMAVPFAEDSGCALSAVIYPSAIDFFGYEGELSALEYNSHSLIFLVEDQLVGVRLKDGTSQTFEAYMGEGWESMAGRFDYRFDISTILQPEQVEALIFTSSDGQTSTDCTVTDSDIAYLSPREDSERDYQKFIASQSTEWTDVDLSEFSVGRTPEFLAVNEWADFYWSYTEDADIPNTVGDPSDKYWNHHVYDQTMADKMDELMEKYGLQPMTGVNHVGEEDWTSTMVSKLFPGCSLQGSDCWGYYYDCGSFRLDLTYYWDSAVADIFSGDTIIFCFKKGYMPWTMGLGIEINEHVSVELWEYVTSDGTKVLLGLYHPDELSVMEQPRGVIMADLDDAIVDISSDGIETRADLEHLADQIDFSAF